MAPDVTIRLEWLIEVSGFSMRLDLPKLAVSSTFSVFLAS